MFRLKNQRGDIYSLSITCTPTNEPVFRKLYDVVARESCGLVPKVEGKKLKPEDFDLVKGNRSGKEVFAKIYSRSLARLNVEYP